MRVLDKIRISSTVCAKAVFIFDYISDCNITLSVDFINSLPSNGWIALISFVLGMVSFAYTIYSIRKKRLSKRIGYRFITRPIVPYEKLSGLKIIFREVEAKGLSMTEYRFQNLGDQLISKADLTPASPFQIIGHPNVQIIHFEIVCKNDYGLVEGALDRNENTINISFDHLGVNDSFSIKIFHSSNVKPLFVVNGATREGGKFKILKNRIFIFRRLRLITVLTYIAVVLYLSIKAPILFVLFLVTFIGYAFYSYFNRQIKELSDKEEWHAKP